MRLLLLVQRVETRLRGRLANDSLNGGDVDRSLRRWNNRGYSHAAMAVEVSLEGDL